MCVVLGERAFKIATATVLVGILGALTGFLIIIGDLGHAALSEWSLGTHWEHSAWIDPSVVVIVFATVVVFPLSFVERMHTLSGSSALSAVSVLSVALLVTVRGAEAVHEGDDARHVALAQPRTHNLPVASQDSCFLSFKFPRQRVGRPALKPFC